MKSMALFLLIATGMALGSCPPKTFERPPDKVLKKEGWELRAWLTARGTRSLGIWYRLYHDGKEICPAKGQTTIETPLGRLIYKENPTPFDWHGWTPQDDSSHMLMLH